MKKIKSFLKKCSKKMILDNLYKCIESYILTDIIHALYFYTEDQELKLFKINKNFNTKKTYLILLYKIDFNNFLALYNTLMLNNQILEDFKKNLSSENRNIFKQNFYDYYKNENNYKIIIDDMIITSEEYYLSIIKEESILKYYRLKTGFTAKTVSKLLNCHIQQIYDWENKKRNPNYNHIKALSEIYKISSKDLLYEIKNN